MKSMSETNEIEIIGKSTEGRELKLIKIGNSTDKEIIWIDGGTHAREWIGPATALFMAYQVARAKRNCEEESSSSNCDPEMKSLLDRYDFYFEPSVNPDGYVFSHESVRNTLRNVTLITSFCPRTAFGGKPDQVRMSIHGQSFAKASIQTGITMQSGVARDQVEIRARKHTPGRHLIRNRK